MLNSETTEKKTLGDGGGRRGRLATAIVLSARRTVKGGRERTMGQRAGDGVEDKDAAALVCNQYFTG